MGKLASER